MTRRIFITVLCLIGLALAWTGQLDDIGKDAAEKAFKRALVTFAVARTLDGVISVAQGTELAVEPAGVGVNFAPGQILDPINDLVERFSSVMLVATSALGVHNILLRVSHWWVFNLLLVLSAAALVVCLWLPAARRWQAPASKLVLVTVALRFAVPLVIIGTGLIFDTFLEAQHAAATEALQVTTGEIRQMNEQAASPDEDSGFLARISTLIDESLDSVNVAQRLEEFRARLSGASEQIINLIVVFVLQTIVIPIVFLWALVQLMKKFFA